LNRINNKTTSKKYNKINQTVIFFIFESRNKANKMNFDRKNLTNETLLDLYQKIQAETYRRKMLILIRQGKVSKWFSGIGQEAFVGVTAIWIMMSIYYLCIEI
jgi:TPP-dependent pyruvate/acetoin dehydrogenase alpha subunit